MLKILKILFIITGSFLFADTGSISGKVTGDSMPLAGANVFLVGTSMGATTDSLGSYLIENVPVGKYSLRADYIGYESSSMEIYVSASDVGSGDSGESSFTAKLGIEEDEETDMVKGNQLVGINFNLFSSALGLNEVVVSAAKVQQKITEAPSVIAVVNNRTIRRRTGVDDFNRLASFVKGVDVIYYGVQGAQINARGFDGGYSTRFRQYTDGLYIGEAVSGQVYSVISGPPKEAISRIEVLFGPQAALYGPDASQGLLNIITKTPKTDDENEINFSVSNLDKYRFGGRFTKAYDKFAFDISGTATRANELPYENTDTENPIWWELGGDGEKSYLNEDYYSPLELDRTQLRTTGYYYLNSNSEVSIFYNIIDGKGYAMGSLGPIYNRDMDQKQYGLKFNNRNHALRLTVIDQIADAQFRSQLAIFQVSNRDANDKSLPWEEALDAYDNDSTSYWLKFNSRDFIVDYQFNQRVSNRIQLVSGLDYEFKNPDTDRTAIADKGEDPFVGGLRGEDLKEYRYGIYGQFEYDLLNNYSLTGSIRFDGHEFYGDKVSPRIALVKENFLNGSLKLIAGTGFKAPTLMERNVFSGTKSVFGGTVQQGYPVDWVANAIAMGSSEGFTLLEFKDKDFDGIYSESDSLLNSNFIEPLKLEELQSIELAYTGIINSKNMISFNAYGGNYKNFKGPLTLIGLTGSGWNPYVDYFTSPLENDEVRQINIGDKLISDEPLPPWTYFLTYQTLPIDVMFFGIDGGWKHLGEKYEIEMNFSYFNDDDLNGKRDKGKKYELVRDFPDSSATNNADSIYSDYYDYRRIYSNTSNLKGSLVFSSLNTFVEGLTTSLSLKWTKPFDFVSGDFEATAEREGQFSQFSGGTASWYINPGQIGGGVYSDLDMVYQLNDNVHFGFSIKNIFESQGTTFPLSPKIPRSFEFETGYRF